jgi:hypothetical protein
MLPLHRFESRRQRKPLRKISFHSCFLITPCALANALKPAGGSVSSHGQWSIMNRQLLYQYPQSRHYQTRLLFSGSRMNLAYQSGDALLSVYFARGIIAASFCPIRGSRRNSLPVPRWLNLAESRRQREKRSTELPVGFRCWD